MSMINTKDILETIKMIEEEHLDIRTITMGISLRDLAADDINVLADKVYDKVTRRAEKLVATGEQIERELGIPIINKRISVTPIAMVGATSSANSYVPLAKALDRAAETTGVNFVGGFSALVQKGFRQGRRDPHQLHSGGYGGDQSGLLLGQRRLHQGRRQPRRDRSDGPHHQADRRADEGQRLHGLLQAGRFRQRRRRQPVHGGRVPRHR